MKVLKSLLCVLVILSLGASVFACTPGFGIAGDPTPIVTEEPDPTPVPRDISGDSNMSKSVVFGNEEANSVKGYYGSEGRLDYIVKNFNSGAVINLNGAEELGLYAIKDTSSNSFIEGGMTGFLTDSKGNIYKTSASTTEGRINTSRIGIYYYENNIHGLNFGNEIDFENSVTNVTKICKNVNVGNMNIIDLDKLSVKNNNISFVIASTHDPYISIKSGEDIGGANVVILEMSAEDATNGTLFYSTSISGGYNSKYTENFKIVGDGKVHKIYIPVGNAAFDGVLNSIRFDIDGAKAGSKVEIKSISLGKINEGLDEIPCGYEQILHTYTDRLFNQFRVLFDNDSNNIKSFGYMYEIPASKVVAVKYMDKNGVSDDISMIDENSVVFVCFDIKDIGLVGIITPYDIQTKVSLNLDNGKYILKNYVDVTADMSKGGTDIILGHRIFTSKSHDFGEIEREAYFERNPLEVTVDSLSNKSKTKYVGYDSLTGSYHITLDGIGFQSAYNKGNKANPYGGTVTIKNDEKYERTVYIWTDGANGCLEAAAILDENNILSPLLPQVGKNFKGEFEEPYYDPEDAEYGYAIYPIVLNKTESNVHTFYHLYQKWGEANLKQVSSIAFHIGYYHLSTGTTESNCIAPYFVYGRDGWTLPDFRGCSGKMWSGQPQFNSVGRLRWLSINGEYAEYVDTNIRSSGPVYADIEYNYKFDNNAIEYSLRHIEFPSTDENRTFYEVKVKFTDDITIENVSDMFTLFDFDPRFDFMSYLAYKGLDGNDVVIEEKQELRAPVKYILPQDQSYFTYYYFTKEAIENFGLIIKDVDAKISGKPYTGNLILRDSVKNDGGVMNFGELTLDLGTTVFKKGDYINMQLILLPYGLPKQKNYDNVKYVFEDSVLNPWRIVSATTGSVVTDNSPYLAEIMAQDNVAEFTVSGSRDYSAIRVDGCTKYGRLQIFELVGSEYVPVKINYNDFDGYQINYNLDGTYSYSVNVKIDDFATTRTFKVVIV